MIMILRDYGLSFTVFDLLAFRRLCLRPLSCMESSMASVCFPRSMAVTLLSFNLALKRSSARCRVLIESQVLFVSYRNVHRVVVA